MGLSMRTLLINPPSPTGTTINREGAAGLGNQYLTERAFLYPPQTLATVAAAAREAGLGPILLDATAEQLGAHEAMQRVHSAEPEAIGVFLSWVGWESDLAFCRRLRAEFPTARLVTVGPILRQESWAQGAAQVSDVVLIGEPDRAFVGAIEVAVEEQSRSGLIVSAHQLMPAHHDADGYLLDIEGLPMPAWDLVPVSRYRMLTLLGSRGCDAHCSYCPYVIGWGNAFRPCSPPRVVDELEWLTRQFDPPRVIFRDPVFAYSRDRVIGICEELLPRRVSVAWECESRPEHFDTELLRLMQKAGCVTVKLGVESGDPGRLAALNRVSSEDEAAAYLACVRSTVQTCRQIGLRCQVFLMAGWATLPHGGRPASSPEEMSNTVNLMRALSPQHLSVKAIERYPGTGWAASHDEADLRAVEQLRSQASGCVSHPSTPERSRRDRAFAWLRKRVASLVGRART